MTNGLDVLCKTIEGSECQIKELETNQVTENLNSGNDNDSCPIQILLTVIEFESEDLKINNEEGF